VRNNPVSSYDMNEIILSHGMRSNFPSTICWRCCSFSNVGFWLLCQKSNCCSCVDLFLVFYSTESGLFWVSTIPFLLLWLYNIIWNLVLWYTPFLYLLRIIFAIESFMLPWILGMIFICLWKRGIGILMRISLNV
jgi:hypothetical protein